MSAGFDAVAGRGHESLLAISGLRVCYKSGDSRAAAVDGVDLGLQPGEALGIAGESGCGKTTIALACLGLLPSSAEVEGYIRFQGREIIGAKPGQLRAIRWAGISIVFQGAMNALNPVKRVGDQIAEAILLHENTSEEVAHERARSLMEEVGIPRGRSGDYPHEFSGGMRQRTMIAMALACSPPLVIADEPTTALDVMTQAQILELVARLRRDKGIGLIVITHDLSVLSEVADRVAIMYAGHIVEEGPAVEVLTSPAHPYSEALIGAFPTIGDPRSRGVPMGLPGDPPHPEDRPSGCPFHPRCPKVFEPCDTVEVQLAPVGPGRSAACHLLSRVSQ